MAQYRLTLTFTLLCCFCLKTGAVPFLHTDSIPAHVDWNERDSIVGLGKRFSFHTNVIGWALAFPNAGVEFDLSGRETQRYSLLLNVNYRPSLYNKVNPRFVLNAFQVKGEVRKYWRTFLSPDYDDKLRQRDTTLSWFISNISFFRRRYLSGYQPLKARDWRAYYVGLFAAADKYTLNLNNSGRQGTGFTIGLSGGYDKPLYYFPNGAAIDFEAGLSLGLRVHDYDTFGYEEESHCYTFTKHYDWEAVPYPWLQDVHVSLVYRFTGIGQKVKGYRERFEAFEAKRERREAIRDSISIDKRRVRDSLAEVERIRQDSLFEIEIQAYRLQYNQLVVDSAGSRRKNDFERIVSDSIQLRENRNVAWKKYRTRNKKNKKKGGDE